MCGWQMFQVMLLQIECCHETAIPTGDHGSVLLACWGLLHMQMLNIIVPLKLKPQLRSTNAAAEVAAMKKENFHKHKVEKHETPCPWCKSLDFSK